MYSLRSSTRRGGASQSVDSREPPARDSSISTRSTRSTTKPSTTTSISNSRGRKKLVPTIRAKQSFPLLPPTIPPLPPTTPPLPPTIYDLPAEVKHLIASFLNVRDTQTLVRVNQQWRSAAEPFNWRCISVYPSSQVTINALACWTDLASTVSTRPDLAARVDRFRYTPHDNHRLKTSMMTVLRALAPTLREMVLEFECGLDRRFSDLRAGAVMLADVRVLPNLVRLTCRSSSYTDEFKDIVRILRHTPSLRYLDVHFEGWTVGQSLQDAELMLPSLEELKIDAYEPEPIAAALLPISPRLKHLELASDLDQEDVNNVDDPDWEAEEFTSEILTILRHKGLSSLDLGAQSSSAILDSIRANEDGGLLENVRTLSIWAPLCSTKPRLPNLEVLCIVTWGYPIPYFFAGSPTIRCTGRLGNWVIDLIDDQIKLTCLMISASRVGISWIKENAGTKGFHCRVYRNPNVPHSLYHVRARAKDIPSGLIATHPEYWYSRDPRLPVSAPEIDFDDSGAAEDGWFDLTWFLGRPIPTDMLEMIAQDAGHERLWTTGQRDLTLSDEVWHELEAQRFAMLVGQYTRVP